MRPFEYLVALAIAYCFSALGERILGRRSATLAGWNMSFLVGLSASAAAFFPLSLVLPGNALNATVAVLIGIGLLRRFGKQVADRPRLVSAWGEYGIWSKALLVLAILVCVQFTAQNYRLTYSWDGYQIWATKALVLYERGALTQDLLTPHDPALSGIPNCCDGTVRVTPYPHLVPLFEALVARIQGDFSWEAVKAIFPFFFVSLLMSTYATAQALVPRGPAIAAAVLLGLIPAVATGNNIGGYADMPQAALLAGALAALLSGEPRSAPSYRHPAPWVLGGILLVKSEGAILFAVAAAVIAAVWLSRGKQEFASRLRRSAGAIAIGVSCAMLRLFYLEWMSAKDSTYGPMDRDHLSAAWNNLWEVPKTCARFMFDRAEWGFFWPAFFVAVGILLWRGRRREIAIAGGTLLALASYTSIFYFTNWEFHLHIEQAYTRLLSQLAPVAAVLIVTAYVSLASGVLPGLKPEEPEFDTPVEVKSGADHEAPGWTSAQVLVPAAIIAVLLAGGAVAVLRGAREPAEATAIPPKPPVIGYLDQVDGKSTIATVQGSELDVSGWAACADSASPLAKLEILVDDDVQATAVLKARPRPDVAAAFSRADLSQSGWKASFAIQGLQPGSHELTALGTCANGDSGALPPFHLIVSQR